MDIFLVATAFVFGFVAQQIKLPPLVGFLAAGFALNVAGVETSPTLRDLADIGVLLLLFSIGLKVQVKKLLEPQIWAVASIHMGILTGILCLAVLGLGLTGLFNFAGVDTGQALVMGFALSFSSTVFAVKLLEQRGDMGSKQGRISIGVLIMQDLFAVLFITASSGQLPSPWALALLGLFFLRKPLFVILDRSGHGELLVLLSCILPIAGASVFEFVGMKPDLGALLLGMLLAGHPKTDELARAMLGFKDMFLVGFFLIIGMTGLPDFSAFWSAGLLLPFIPLKAAAFFYLFTRYSLRARTALLSAMNLANYSEFGLIVMALAVHQAWLGPQWLVTFALALSISMILAAPAASLALRAYNRWNHFFQKFETLKRLPDDQDIDIGNAGVAIFGMGRVGTGAYDNLRKKYGRNVIGVDIDPVQVARHRDEGRRVVAGDAEDHDFWERGLTQPDQVVLILLTMSHTANLAAARQITEARGAQSSTLAASVVFDDEIPELEAAGVDLVFNVYAEAGTGFSDHVCRRAEAGGCLGDGVDDSSGEMSCDTPPCR